ncbi:MAG: hypothetical protein AAFV29_04180 [Myxococcota bacterium]
MAILAACNNVETGLLVEEVTPPTFDEDTGGCSFEPGSIDFPLTFDAQQMSVMNVRTEVTNVLSPDGGSTVIVTDPELIVAPSLSVTPLRFDFRWECDSNGFTAGQGPLILPAFSVENPFCLDTRDEANSDFAGFDVVSATGTRVAPGETAIWSITPITPQLGDALQTAFRLAELSENCCTQAGGCQNAPNQATVGFCADLQALLNDVAPGSFDVQVPETVNIWRPYIFYTAQGTNALGQTRIPGFPLRLRGIYEGITAEGDLVTSTEFIRDINVCKGEVAGAGGLGACTSQLTINCMQ